jgi:DNA-binding HxlR family transcriptional regulator
MSAAVPEMPQRKMNVVLSALDTPKTWTELKGEVPVSKATLASRIKQLQTMNLIDKQRHENGTTKYTLTGVAQELRKRKPKK